MNVIKILKPDGTTTEIEGSIVSVTERRGHPYLDKFGNITDNFVRNKQGHAFIELRRFQQMGELPVDGECQWEINWNGKVSSEYKLSFKTSQLTAFFPTHEAAEKALKDFGGWEHLRRVRKDIHMVGE